MGTYVAKHVKRVETTGMVRIRQSAATAAKHAKHPVTHLSAAVTLHVIALFILDKTPILVLIGLAH